MAGSITKKCPTCGYEYQSIQIEDQVRYGCPLVFCPKCKNGIWDPDVKEPALYGFDDTHAKRDLILLLIRMIALLLFCSAVFVVSLVFVINGNLAWIVGMVLGGIGCIPPGLITKSLIHSLRFPEEEQRLQQNAYDASKERLSNEDYLLALSNHDPLAKRLLNERNKGEVEHYAKRPEVKTRVREERTQRICNDKQIKKEKTDTVKTGKTTTAFSQKETLETIEKMKVLYDAGILTQEEYETKKAELLKRL